MVEEFNSFDPGWFDHQLREYQKNNRKLDQLEKKKKQELDYVKTFYAKQEEKINAEQELIKSDLGDYLHKYSMTSQTTAFGNVHLQTAGNKFYWKDLTAKQKRAIADRLPDEYVNREPKEGLINKNATITDSGQVVLNDTGEIIEGLTGKQGGYKTISIRKGAIN